MSNAPVPILLTIACPAVVGIVAAVSSRLTETGCNILDCSQFIDEATGTFFMRVSFYSHQGATAESLSAGFGDVAERFSMTYAFHDAAAPMKTVLMVSRFGHCLLDLFYRIGAQELPIEVTAVIPNHEDFRKETEARGIPFHHIPVTPDTKPEAEAAQMKVIEETGAELVVLARYMQILSDRMCAAMSGRIINIHHAFLPGFKGANPYRRAHARGVKLVGATAHYVTADLDEGPIIEQEVIRVTHAQSAADLAALGRDVEARTLARAVHAHIHRRAFLNGEKTVVFPPSPGEFAPEAA